MPLYRPTLRDLLSWPLLPVLIVGAGLLLAGVPEDFLGEDFEGPTLVRLGESHGLQVSNLLAIAALLAGSAGLLWGGWRRAAELKASTSKRPVATALLALQLATGVGLILMSGISTTLLWWGMGTFLSVTALLGLSWVVKQGIP